MRRGSGGSRDCAVGQGHRAPVPELSLGTTESNRTRGGRHAPVQRPSFSQSSSLTLTTPSVKTQTELPKLYDPLGKRGTFPLHTKTHPPIHPLTLLLPSLPPCFLYVHLPTHPYTSCLPSFLPSIQHFLSAKYWILRQTQGRQRFMRPAPILGDPKPRRHWQVGRRR